MKATGIIRRVDDLGRVCIPKEIRRALNIRELDQLKIYTVDNTVVLEPCRPKNAAEFAAKWLNNNPNAFDLSSARFTIESTTVTCEVVDSKRRRSVGTAKCDTAKDVFNPTVGMVIAWHRAAGADVPAELL